MDTLLAPIVTAVASFLGAWLAARFALARFYREKVWERKTAAYTAIFDALHDMERWFAEQNGALSDGRELSQERIDALSAAYRVAKANLQRRLASETWLIPEEIRRRIEHGLVDLDLAASRITDWVELVIQGHEVIYLLEADVRKAVLRDLRLQRFHPISEVAAKISRYCERRRLAKLTASAPKPDSAS
jgi:hypothetical protein